MISEGRNYVSTATTNLLYSPYNQIIKTNNQIFKITIVWIRPRLVVVGSNEKENQSSRLACVGKSLKEPGISERVSKILLSSWRSSTETHYQSKWKSFDNWCFEKTEDPISCPINIVSEIFL